MSYPELFFQSGDTTLINVKNIRNVNLSHVFLPPASVMILVQSATESLFRVICRTKRHTHKCQDLALMHCV